MDEFRRTRSKPRTAWPDSRGWRDPDSVSVARSLRGDVGQEAGGILVATRIHTLSAQVRGERTAMRPPGGLAVHLLSGRSAIPLLQGTEEWKFTPEPQLRLTLYSKGLCKEA